MYQGAAIRLYRRNVYRLPIRVWKASTGFMIRKLRSGEYRLYSRKKDEATGKRRNLGTFPSLEKAKQHEREVQYFKKH
jgi:hypothetical protein